MNSERTLQVSKSFDMYGAEPSFEFDYDVVGIKGFKGFFGICENVDDAINVAIERLLVFDPYKACVMSRWIGSCVEEGFDSPKLDLFSEFCKKITDLCLDFIEDFRKAMGPSEEDEAFDMDEVFINKSEEDEKKLMNVNPDGYRAIEGHYYMILSVMTVICRDGKKRNALRDYYNKFERLSGFFGNFKYLVRGLALCDEERFIVIDTETKNGWECSARQIENNFSLMSLLQSCFHHAGILKKMNIEYEYNAEADLIAHNHFDFKEKKPSVDRDWTLLDILNYRAYQTDGSCVSIEDAIRTIPEALIWGEMGVSFIPKIDDYSIILINKSDKIGFRSWDIQFLTPVHPAVEPEFEIIRTLEKIEVDGWLERILAEKSK